MSCLPERIPQQLSSNMHRLRILRLLFDRFFCSLSCVFSWVTFCIVGGGSNLEAAGWIREHRRVDQSRSRAPLRVRQAAWNLDCCSEDAQKWPVGETQGPGGTRWGAVVKSKNNPFFRDRTFFGFPFFDLRSGFRAQNGEFKCSGGTGLQGDNSPFRCATPKLTSDLDSPYPQPYSTYFLVPNRTGFQPDKKPRPMPKYCSVW